MIRLFAGIRYQWNPAQGPKQKERDTGDGPRLPHGKGSNFAPRFLMATGTRHDDHGESRKIGIGTGSYGHDQWLAKRLILWGFFLWCRRGWIGRDGGIRDERCYRNFRLCHSSRGATFVAFSKDFHLESSL
jgi:hypothetical protein